MKSIRGKWGKSGLLILILALCVFLLTACAGASKTKLSSDYDQAKIKEAGIRIIDLVNAQDNQAIRDMSTEEIKQTLTDEAIQQVHNQVQELGKFKELKNVEVFGYKNKQGNEYAVFVARAMYHKNSLVYTFNFTKDTELSGFYVK